MNDHTTVAERAVQMRDSFAALVTAAVREGMAAGAGDTGECLTVADVADRLAVCRDTVDKLIRRGDLPSIRVGRSVRVRLVDLIAYEQSQVVR